MSDQLYNFYAIFDYAPANGIITPKFDVIINNALLRRGVPITPSTFTGGVSLFQYVGRSFAGVWNEKARQLTIERFY